MPTNDFLPIAIAGGAPVMTQADWVAATPAAGRGPGIVSKEYFNKANRQSSVMAAAIGLFLNNNGEDAFDNGDIPSLAAAFAAALGGANAPAFFSLRTQDGSLSVRTVDLAAGTYQLSLLSLYEIIDPGSSTFDSTATQSGIVGSTTLNTSARAIRLGGSGYGRAAYTQGFAVGSLIVPSAGSYTMTMTAAITGNVNYVAKGSILTCERVA